MMNQNVRVRKTEWMIWGAALLSAASITLLGGTGCSKKGSPSVAAKKDDAKCYLNGIKITLAFCCQNGLPIVHPAPKGCPEDNSATTTLAGAASENTDPSQSLPAGPVWG